MQKQPAQPLDVDERTILAVEIGSRVEAIAALSARALLGDVPVDGVLEANVKLAEWCRLWLAVLT